MENDNNPNEPAGDGLEDEVDSQKLLKKWRSMGDGTLEARRRELEEAELRVLNADDDLVLVLDEAPRSVDQKAGPKIERQNDADVYDLLKNKNAEVDLEDDWGGSRRVVPVGWIFLVAIVILAALFWGGARIRPNVEEVAAAQVDENAILIESVTNLDDVVSHYLSAESVEEKLKWVRHPERVEPLMREYYQTHEIAPVEVVEVLSRAPRSFSSRPFVMVSVRVQDGGRRLLVVEQGESGVARVDWGNDVHYMPMAWDEFIAQRPTESLDMRVRVVPVPHYVYDFSDEAKYQCYQVTAKEGEENLYAYVERNSSAGRYLRAYFRMISSRSSLGEPLILRLRFPDEARHKKALLVDKVISSRWVVVNDPDEGE